MTITIYRKSMKEVEMRAAIDDLVRLKAGRLFYIRDSRGAAETEGMLDLQLILPHMRTVAMVELKSQNRKLTPEQMDVLAMLQECNRVESFVCRPEPRDETEVSLDRLLGWINGGER